MLYKAGLGLGLSTGMLTTLVPQPRSVGVQTTRRSYAADGTIFEEGDHVELIFNLLETDASYSTLLGYFGLVDALVSEVTIRAPSQFFTDTLYQGVAVRPQHGKEASRDYFPRNVTILVRNLEQLVEA